LIFVDFFPEFCRNSRARVVKIGDENPDFWKNVVDHDGFFAKTAGATPQMVGKYTPNNGIYGTKTLLPPPKSGVHDAKTGGARPPKTVFAVQKCKKPPKFRPKPGFSAKIAKNRQKSTKIAQN
jgi:hypothetical protein